MRATGSPWARRQLQFLQWVCKDAVVASGQGTRATNPTTEAEGGEQKHATSIFLLPWTHTLDPWRMPGLVSSLWADYSNVETCAAISARHFCDMLGGTLGYTAETSTVGISGLVKIGLSEPS